MGTVNYSGLVVAGLGFFLTRFTVTLVIYDDPARFYLAGIVPLAIGLGLAAFGVALTVADVEPALVRTTAIWSLIGFGTMAILVVLTLLGASAEGSAGLSTLREQTVLSNFLIGGSVGGTLTGLYAARNRRQRRQLRQQANRLVTLNRILRHEILNSVSAIRGFASVDPEANPEAQSVIQDRSLSIERAVEEVKYLTQRTGTNAVPLVAISLVDSLAESVETVNDRHSDAEVAVDLDVDGSNAHLAVLANEQLSKVFTHLIENAIIHTDDREPTVTATATSSTVTVRVSDDGPGLPESQRSLLETGNIEEFDDPTTGFGLNIVRLLVESYDGTIETDASEAGTTVAVTLPRAGSGVRRQGPSRTDLAAVRPAVPHLLVGVFAALVAGVGYGLSSELLGGSVAGIGVFYGEPNPVVGWLTHQFHSIVFGLVYLGLLSITLERYRNSLATYIGTALGWALIVWVVAASLVAPTWLRLLGIPVGIPTFEADLLANHLVWGSILGLVTAVGYRWLAKR